MTRFLHTPLPALTRSNPASDTRPGGYTLIELVLVMTLIAVLASVTAVMTKPMVDSYMATQRRADLSDTADTALRRMARDLRLSLPNSIRVTPAAQPAGTTSYVEMLITKTGGRYRAQLTAASTGNILDFSSSDTSFNVYGDLTTLPAGQVPAVNDIVAVFNLFAVSTQPQGNAYTYGSGNCTAASSATCNTSRISAAPTYSAGETTITIDARQFPQPSGGNRFHVIDPSPVTYVCAPNVTPSMRPATARAR